MQNFLTSAKDHQQNEYNLEDSISDFLIYYNDRPHSTTKVAPFKAMMNVENQELMAKIRNNTLQRRKDAKMFSEHYPNDCIIRVSNFIRLVGENHIRFDPPRGHMKSVLKE